MFSKVNWFNTFLYGTLAAIAFSIPALFYVLDETYMASWLLFLGAGLFFAVTAVHTYRESRLRGGNESTVTLVFISHVTTIVGIIISCILAFLMLSVLVPGYLSPGDTDKAMEMAPPNSIFDKTDGLSFKLFMAATIVNFAGGSIAGITIPFYAKRNQTRDSKEPSPLQQRTVS